MAEEQKNIKFTPVGKPTPNIGVDNKNSIVNKLANDNSYNTAISYDIINSFRTISDQREFQYKVFDEMVQDVIISSAIELYADDATEYNDNGKIIWAKSSDTEVEKTANYLLQALKLDENAWSHISRLVTYGDLYLETFRKSDLNEEQIGKMNLKENSDTNTLNSNLKNNKAKLTEDIIVNIYGKDDRLQEYIEAVPNPAEIFDLTKRGKTVGFLKTKINQTTANSSNSVAYNYNFSDDVKIFDPTKFIHITLPDPNNRNPETVKIFNSSSSSIKKKDREKEEESLFFQVKRGKSILYNLFKIYREMKLLEDSILLNRVTRSALVRIIQVEVGDMGKAQVTQLLQRVKAMFDEKIAFDKDKGLSQFNSANPIENNVYVPTREGKGQITTNTLGGDFNVGELTDLNFFLNKLFAGLKIPKPFLGFMDDNAGFSGGESLAKVSSRYAKTIKRIQNAYIQGIKTLLNILFLDRGLDNYVNKFEVKMQSPSTVEDSDRIESLSSKVALAGDIFSLFNDVEDSTDRLKIALTLAKNYLTDSELITIVEEIIEKKEQEPEDNDLPEEKNTLGAIDSEVEDTLDFDIDASTRSETQEDDTSLPNPKDLDIDFSDNDKMSSTLK